MPDASILNGLQLLILLKQVISFHSPRADLNV